MSEGSLGPALPSRERRARLFRTPLGGGCKSGLGLDAPFFWGARLGTVGHVSFPIVTEPFDISRGSVGSTSSSFLDRVKARDEGAWRRLESVYGHLVLYWCRYYGVRREDRADVCQDVFRAVAVSIDSFQRDQTGGTFRGWLRTITRSKIADHFRRQNRQPDAQGGTDAYERFLEIPDGDSAAASEVSDQETAIIVNRTLDLIRPEFEDRTWQAFWRAAVEGQLVRRGRRGIGNDTWGSQAGEIARPPSFEGGIAPASRTGRL